MKVSYSRRAISDLKEIGAYYAVHASPRVATDIEARVRALVERISKAPESARKSRKTHGCASFL
jgi:plasmid stabilization system protein ParE